MENNSFIFDQVAVGKRLKALRKNSGITVDKLSEKMGVTEAAIYKWHRGDSVPDVSKLVELSEIYDVSIDYILKGA